MSQDYVGQRKIMCQDVCLQGRNQDLKNAEVNGLGWGGVLGQRMLYFPLNLII